MKRHAHRTVWSCPHCRQLIEADDPVNVVDHMLDEHLEILIRDKPVFPLVGRK